MRGKFLHFQETSRSLMLSVGKITDKWKGDVINPTEPTETDHESAFLVDDDE